MALVLSIVALILGPFVYVLGQRWPNARQILDGFIFITIAGIVCVHIIPPAIHTGGALTFLFLGFGLVFPLIVERSFSQSHERAHVFIVILAAVGLAVHATIDGIALLPLGDLQSLTRGPWDFLFGNELAVSVILHRLPVGMAIWWSIRSGFGTSYAVAAFALIIAATAAAYFLGEPVASLAHTRGIAWFQAFVAGSLVHIVAFGVGHDHAQARENFSNTWGFRVGILAGLFVLFTGPHLHG